MQLTRAAPFFDMHKNNGTGKKSAPLFSFGLFERPVSAHERRQLSDTLYRERRGAQRFHRYAHQLHRVVVCGDAVRGHRTASAATVDYCPFAVFLTQTAMGSMIPPQSEALSPGSISTCRLERQFEQWFLWLLPAPCGTTVRPHTLQTKASLQAWVL